ncbi:succinate dehydrogenase assembly factor 3, mitochondrial-like [Lineus longissimus]|uniref:succinate dehydrogenase assembly factor 3, mitochondrial-like n=1 Tax=Lineus longissimus TaxID=88925 RepID=UPI002B4F8F16
MATHVARVRLLYKSILRLHRGLPVELQAVGTQYVRDEFRRHKDATPEATEKFMKEWIIYCNMLAKQLGKRTKVQTIGADLADDTLGTLTEEQIGQLYELRSESVKPRDPENPFGPPLDEAKS